MTGLGLKKLTMLVSLICGMSSFAGNGLVQNVVARQIQPWQGLVEISYELTEDAVPADMTNRVDQKVIVYDLQNETNFVAKTFTRPPTFEKGVHRLVWNVAADGFSFASTNVVFEILIEGPGPQELTPLYQVVDVSEGAAAESYPILSLSEVPPGGWTDEYKTTKIVLRRIDAGSFKMQETEACTLTKGFYVGVFEVTQRQWELVMGTRRGFFSNKSCYMTRPVERVSYNLIRGSTSGAGWPGTVSVDETSFLGRLRARTGLDLDLPTEAQWEYACRAGTTTAYNNGTDQSDENMERVGRYGKNSGLATVASTSDLSEGTAAVGSYLPNAWGLYDMHGNVWEWCLDWYGTLGPGTDPIGPTSGGKRVKRGGSWYDGSSYCTSSSRDNSSPSYSDSYLGFRLCRRLSN